MSYETNVHAAQMQILRHLLLAESARYSELQKKTDLSSDHFNFHITKLTDVGYVQKDDDRYRLTRRGKEYANRMDTDENVIEKQPKLSVVLVIEHDDGRILQQERLKQPYYGFWGFPTGKIRWGETIIEAAARELMEETGLNATLREAGVFHKMDYDKITSELLEDKYFCIIHGTHPTGELIIDAEGHHNEWLVHEEVLQKEKVFESIRETAELAKRGGFHLIEKKYYYDPEEY
ncbi:MAG: NUDIX domain-containing protein [Candidatus Saccharimonas sp.]|nr:NUDIX domain-containing protein [Candidatus Saccharimonas sp.]